MLRVSHQLVPNFAILLASTLPEGVTLDALPRDALWEVPKDATVLLAEPIFGAGAYPDRPPAGWPRQLRWVQTVSTGIDEYPPWLLEVPLVTCGRGSNANAIAEFALAAMLAVAKRLPEVWIRSAAKWRHIELGTLQGKTLGLIGYGAIGQAVARLSRPFGMTVLATSRTATPGTTAGAVRFATLEAVFAAADHLVVAVPLTAATAHLVNARTLALIKPGAHLVNVSRGGTLDQAALLSALDGGQLGFASLDVTDPEPLPDGHAFYAHERIHISPHVSWSNGSRGQEFAALFAENVRRYMAGEELMNVVTREKGY